MKLDLPIRLLGTVTTLALAGIGFAAWRISAVFLEMYRDFEVAETSRHSVLGLLSSLPLVGTVSVVSFVLLWAIWRLRLVRVAWLTLVVLVVDLTLLVALPVFFQRAFSVLTRSMIEIN